MTPAELYAVASAAEHLEEAMDAIDRANLGYLPGLATTWGHLERALATELAR